MAKRTKDTQKEWFYAGAYPTAEQFHDVIDSTIGVLDSDSELPTAGAGNLGNEYKVGNTFYKCEQVDGGYRWVPKATAVPTNSYDDLTEKPTVNSVRVAGDIADIDILGGLSKNVSRYDAAEEADLVAASIVYIKGASKWVKTTLGELVTALNLVNTTVLETFKAAVLQAAAAQTEQALADKMDKDLGNLEYVDSFPGSAIIPIVTESGTKKTDLQNVSAFVETRTAASRTELATVVKEQLKVLPLTGDQNGRNATFACADGYTMSTSCLYLNGQLLTRGTDYTETSSYQIVMLTHIPVSTDVMIFMAVPIA